MLHKVVHNKLHQTMLTLTDEEHAGYKLAVGEMLDTCLRIAVKGWDLDEWEEPSPTTGRCYNHSIACSVYHGPRHERSPAAYWAV